MIKDKSKNNRQVKSIIHIIISPSSFFSKIKDMNGDLLSKVHPIPIGRLLKTICCSNIIIFVLNNIEIRNLFC